MKQKLLNKLWLRVGMIVAIMTTALSGTAWAEDAYYTLDTTGDLRTGNSTYASTGTATSDGIEWAFAGNGTLNPWRLGGKSLNKAERLVYTKTAMGAAIDKVNLTVGAASSITVNSLSLVVASDASFNTIIDEVDAAFSANSTITFEPNRVDNWTKNAYYKFVFKVTVSVTSNKFVEFNKVEFFEVDTTPAYTITAQSNNDSYGTVSLNGSVITATPATGYTYADPAYTVSPANSATVAWEGNEFTVTPTANTTVTINFKAIPTYTVTLGDDNTELEETEPSAGVELPSRSDVGIYTFAGWSATNVTTETTTAPTIIPVGTYNPTADITLYPVYTKTEGGASIETSNVFESGSFANDIITWSIANVISIKQERNGSSHTAPNSSYVSSPRWYSGNLITITPNVSINSISVTTTSEDYATALANSTFSNATASANGTAVTITPEDGSSTIEITMGVQSRLSSLTVNYGGGTTYYYSTPVVKQENQILYVADEYHDQNLSAEGGCSLNLSGVTANHGTLYSEIVTTSTTINPSNYTWESQVLTVSGLTEGEGGTVVIRFWVEEDAEYYGVEKIVTAYFIPQPVIAYDGETESTAYGTPYTIDTDLISGGDITLSSGNTAVATVDGLTITPVAVGSTTITITTAAVYDTWQAGTATFTLNVTAPEGKTVAPTGSAGFEETFANCTGTNDDFGTSTSSDGNGTFTADSDNVWTTENAHGANGSAKFGAIKSSGSATTPSITATVGTTYTLTFKAAPWNTESTTMNVSVDGGTISGISEDAMSTGEWNDFTASITATATSFTVTFAASKNRFFLDEVKVEAPASPAPEIKATLNGRGYATFCSEYPLDFSDYQTAGYSAWEISAVNGEKITFSQITGSVKGGTGILLKGTAGEPITLTSADSEITLSGNKLYGTLAPTYVAADTYYGLSGNEFVKVNAGTVPAGKALLPASALGSNVKAFTFVFEDDATGIEETLSNSPLKGENIYNLAGQMVNGKSVNGKLPKGIYIVNGKKILK